MDEEFQSYHIEDDVDEEKLDAFIDNLLKEVIVPSLPGTRIMNPQKLMEMERFEKMLPQVIGGTKLRFDSGFSELFVGTGYVSVRGREITIPNPKLFRKLTELASNMDITPYLDGTVDMDFAFNDLAKKVRE